tara:strand:+ start:2406 stop:2825 length:420 start_codon:yes stop_codon:yes gene_type:complete
MVVISTIIRAIGLPACIVIGLLAFYEGVPGAHRVPFLSSVPVIGNLVTGRVHAYAADQVRLATAGLVAKAELTAAKAQLARERELRLAADKAATEARNRALAALRLKQDAQKALEERISKDTGKDGAVWTEEDIKWLAQ